MDHAAPDLPPPISVFTPSQHAHHQVRCFRSCPKKINKRPLQTPITNVRAGRHTDSQADSQVSQQLSVSLWSWFCSAPMYHLLASEAALIYEICLNLLLARQVGSSVQPYRTINQPQCPYSWALQRVLSPIPGPGGPSGIVLPLVYPVLKLLLQFKPIPIYHYTEGLFRHWP